MYRHLLHCTVRHLKYSETRIPNWFAIGKCYLNYLLYQVYNIAEILGIPYLEGIVSVTAQFTATSERRIDIQFQRTIIGLKRLMGYGSPTEFITGIESSQPFPAIDFTNPRSEQSGWLDITYLDQDLRISRGNEGSIFILTKAI